MKFTTRLLLRPLWILARHPVRLRSSLIDILVFVVGICAAGGGLYARSPRSRGFAATLRGRVRIAGLAAIVLGVLYHMYRL